jgi:proprotein convertase subtilisin/kexin type 5
MCIPGSYMNTTNNPNTCDSCPIGCATCTSNITCDSCDFPFVPNSLSGCECNSLTLEYYNPNTQNCSSCITIIPFCNSCFSTNYVTICTDCFDGYYFDGTICQPCNSPCTLCSSASAC